MYTDCVKLQNCNLRGLENDKKSFRIMIVFVSCRERVRARMRLSVRLSICGKMKTVITYKLFKLSIWFSIYISQFVLFKGRICLFDPVFVYLVSHFYCCIELLNQPPTTTNQKINIINWGDRLKNSTCLILKTLLLLQQYVCNRLNRIWNKYYQKFLRNKCFFIC